jgi:tape measure domain-containing protein
MEGGDILMSSIDRRVVEMEFDNKQFQGGIKDTLAALDELKKGLNLEGATKGLKGLDASTKGMGLDNISSALENISSKFSAMGAIGFAVIQKLTHAAMDFAKNTLMKAFDPLVAGGKRRALNIEQAKFQFRGLGMDVEATMASALAAVQGTAYGLDEAAKAAGQFGASGMRAGDDMTSALRAISGVAAMTSSSYDDIAQIFTKVAGNGRVMGDDLLRMSSRGLNAAATLADSLGISEAEVRQMVTEGKVSFEMFYQAMDAAFGENATKANETYTGSLANMRAAFARIGARFFTPWLEQQRDLFNALSPAIDEVGEALKPVIDRMSQFTRRATDRKIDFINNRDLSALPAILMRVMAIVRNLGNAFKALTAPIKAAFREVFPPMAMDRVLAILKGIQGFTASLKIGGESADKVRRIFAGLFSLLGIGWEIVKAGAKFFLNLFGQITQGSTGFVDFLANIGDFLVALHQAIKNGEGLSNFFNNFANILRTPIKMLKNFVAMLFGLAEFRPPSAAGLSNFAKNAFEPLGRTGEIIIEVWGRVLFQLHKSWAWLANFGKKIGQAFAPIGAFLNDIFGGVSFDDIIKTLQTGLLGGIFLAVKRLATNMGNTVGSVAFNLTQPFRSLTYTLSVMQTTLRSMTLLSIALAVGVLAASVVALSKVDAAGLTRALTAMSLMFTQLMVSLKAFTMIGGAKGLITTSAGLILFAIALRLLVSSVKSLAKLEWEELSKGLSAVAILMGVLVIAVQGMSGHTAGMFKAGAGLMVLAIGIRILATAVKTLADLSWEELAKGLVGVGGLLASLAIFTRMAAVGKAGLSQGAGLLLLATGIRILANAVVIFASMSPTEIAKGLATVLGILTAFAGFSQLVNPAGIVKSGLAMILISTGMNIMARALKQFGAMDLTEIAKGLAAMGGGLILIVGALQLMPPSTLASAAALVGVSIALNLMGLAMKQIGAMDWNQIAGALMGLGGMLGMIVLAMNAMTGALPGAAALLVVSVALRIFVPVLQTLGSMSIGEIATALITLAAAFAVLGVAGLVLGPIAPILLVLGTAIGLLGVGMLAAGLGVMAFAAGLTALAVAGTAGTAALVNLVTTMLGLLPAVARAIGEALIAFAEVIATAGPAMTGAMDAVLGAIIQAVTNNIPKILNLIEGLVIGMLALLVSLVPKIARAALDIMLAILRSITNKAPTIVREIVKLALAMLRELAIAVPKFVTAAVDIIVGFLRGIERNIGKVIRAGTDVIIALIEGIGKNAVRLARAAADVLIDFLNGLSKAIDDKAPQIRAAGKKLAMSIVNGITFGLAGKVGEVAGKAREMASNAIGAIKGIFKSESPSKVMIEEGKNVGDGLVIGLARSIPKVSGAAEDVASSAVSTMRKTLSGLSDILAMDTDMNPTITPVLDLTDFHRGASKIESLLTDQQVHVDLAYQKAKDASTRYLANEAARNATTTAERVSPPAEITYNQNNYSPKALSAAEIYRQTKNQLSVTKGALTPNAAQES